MINAPVAEATEYTVPAHYIAAIVNGDYSELTAWESNTLNEFLESVRAERGIGHWIVDAEESEFTPFNDVDGLGGDATRMAYVVFGTN